MVSDHANEKQKIIELCSKFINIVWSQVNYDEIEFNEVSSGVANKTYYCSLKKCVLPDDCDETIPKEAIVHLTGSQLFGHNEILKLNGEAAEAVTIERLSAQGMAPKLYGVFTGGRIEEYIPCRTASIEDLRSEEISKAVIRKLARFHTLDLPISKCVDFFDKLSEMDRSRGEMKSFDSYTPEEQASINKLFNFPVESELMWLKKVISGISNRVVCSHNDMNPNNILLKEEFKSIDERILLIDFEMCRYFYRGYDVAYFLRAKKVRIRKEGAKILVDHEDFEDVLNEVLLIEYLKEYARLMKIDFHPEFDTLEHLKIEVDFCDLLCDLVFMVFSRLILANRKDSGRLQSQGSKIDRLKLYDSKKQDLLSKYGAVIPS